jgi:[acyl-carrier-protein] S-malonyltransferase
MLAAGIATWRVLQESNINHPSFAAGHSLGEFTALVAAEVFSFENGLHIVKKRAELMQNAVPSDEGAMAAILGLKDSEVINICNNLKEKGVIEAVNFNSPGQVVVAGEKIIIETSLEVFKEAGAKRAIILPVSVPSHCSLMKEAAIEFKVFLSSINFAKPIFPVVQNFEAIPYDDEEKIKEGLFHQLFNPVRWTQSMEFMSEKKLNIFLEIGPGKVLTSLSKRINRDSNNISIDSMESIENFKEIS